MNFTRLIRGISERFPDNAAVVSGGRTTSFLEFWDLISAVGTLYRDWGVAAEDRIVLVLPNGLDFLLFHFAALKIGAVSVPVKPEYKCWELRHIIDDCAPRLLITEDSWLSANPDSADLRSRIQVVSINGLHYDTDDGDGAVHPVTNHAIASINYSYFGDGQSRGAMLTHANHIYGATGYARHHGFRSDDKPMIIMPMSHIYTLSGCINPGLIRGGALVVVNQVSPKSIFEAIQRHRVTILSSVPVVFELLASSPLKSRYDLSSLRLCVTGGDFMSEDLQRAFQASLGAEIVQGYGLTESLPIICNPSGSLNKPGTLGIPGRKDIEIRIVGESSQSLPPGDVGEIVIRSPTTMAGYYHRLDETRAVLEENWLHTGDLGALDEDGYLHFHGMKKNIINLYGNKVDPLEVRKALLEHPMVKDVQVGVERSMDGGRLMGAVTICAKVLLHESQGATVDEIREFWRARLAAYKVPKKIDLVPSLHPGEGA